MKQLHIITAIFGLACNNKAVCEAGETQLCLCTANTYGVQLCDIDGDSWEPCDCSAEVAAGSGTGSGDGSGAGSGDGSGAGSGDGSGAGSGDGSGAGSGEETEDGDTGSGSGSGSARSSSKGFPWDPNSNDGFNGWNLEIEHSN